MNNITRREIIEKSCNAFVFDEKRTAENLAQLEGEAESRARRINIRKQCRAKMEMLRRQKRRTRAFKLALVWATVIATVFFVAIWYSKGAFWAIFEEL